MSDRYTPEAAPSGEVVHLQLFIAGDEPNSRRAVANLERICKHYLNDRCSLEVIDVLDDFRAALANNILVAPTLLVHNAAPPQTVVGDLSDEPKVLHALRIEAGTSDG